MEGPWQENNRQCKWSQGQCEVSLYIGKVLWTTVSLWPCKSNDWIEPVFIYCVSAMYIHLYMAILLLVAFALKIMGILILVIKTLV